MSGGYTISPKSADVTLEYKDGILIEYGDNKDEEVWMKYIYDNPLSEIYEYACGNIDETKLSPTVRDHMEKWVEEQLGKFAKEDIQIEKKDVLNWLKNKLEQDNVNTNPKLEEWKATAFKTTIEDNKVRVTIPNKPGNTDYKLPELKVPEKNPFRMILAGTVFLDETETKAGTISDGKLGAGEKLLSGIEVTLHKIESSETFIGFLPEEDGGDGNDLIWWNAIGNGIFIPVGADLIIGENGQPTGWIDFGGGIVTDIGDGFVVVEGGTGVSGGTIGIGTIIGGNYDYEFKYPPEIKGEAESSDNIYWQNRGQMKSSSVAKTMTDKNGHYSFDNLDPFADYYVTFKYNGMEYEATNSPEVEYNSADWAVSSKGAESSGSRDAYKNINAGTVVYDYYEIEGIYKTITSLTLNYISANGSYPNMDEIYAKVQEQYANDPEIGSKIAYIKACQVEATAGYSSSGDSSETYPHESIKELFILNVNSADKSWKYDSINGTLVPTEKTEEFAGTAAQLIYPGQLQVHLGLVTRPNTDLSLTSDIIDTTVSINNYDTTYDYGDGFSSYYQYMFKEDYEYETNKNENGVAFYTEDNVHFYITYEITVQNATSLATNIKEITDYYNKEFRFDPNGYTTTKGNHIGAYSTNFGTININTADGNVYADEFKKMIISLDQPVGSGQENGLKIRLTFELVGDTGNNEDPNAKDVLKKYLHEEVETDYSKSWLVDNFAEISAYSTTGSYIDADSKPGNFNIVEFKKAQSEYTDAFIEYWTGGQSEEAGRKLNFWARRIDEITEDDAWSEGMLLTNNAYKRELTGNVWEAISDKIKNSHDLYFSDEYLEYNESNNLGGIIVELIELNKEDKDGNTAQTVRAITRTDDNGEYKFKSYIAGDYTIRFIYGGDGSTPYSNVSMLTDSENLEEREPLPVNGQFYQSTKSNPNSNMTRYWYKDTNYDDKGSVETGLTDEERVLENRYSDAYDDTYTRLTQMNSVIERTSDTKTDDVNTPKEYDYEGIISVENLEHNDQIYAYTSTLELEIEYIRDHIRGGKDNSWYKYNIYDIDFGVTPKPLTDINLEKTVSNVKMYLQDGTKVLDADFKHRQNEDGKDETYLEGEGVNGEVAVKPDMDTIGNLLTYLEYDMTKLQDAKFEITYNFKVTNDSYGAEDGTFETITYVKQGDKIVAVKYYQESTDSLVSYENDDLRKNVIVSHNIEGTASYHPNKLSGEDRNNDRLANYSMTNISNVIDEKEDIKSKATGIIDYVDNHLSFIKKSQAGDDINSSWDIVSRDDYVSSRENYSIVDDERKYEKVGDLVADGTQIKYQSGALYDLLAPGDSREDKLTLVIDLGTSVTTANDYTYDNFAEITRVASTGARINHIEGYDINGNENSSDCILKNMEYPDKYIGKLVPTISTSKATTVQLGTNAGLTETQNIIFIWIGIVTVSLSIFAGGIVLIKKFVLTPNEIIK